MTPDEVIVAAQGICSEYTDSYPTAKSVCYARMNIRQHQLFVLAGGWDREFYGVNVLVRLDGGCADLHTMEGAGVYPVERIDELRVEDRGTSATRENGERVNIVPAYDTGQHLPPRVTIRSGNLQHVDSDLSGVASLRMWYSRRPKAIGMDGMVGDEDDPKLELGSPWDSLLIWDLARHLIRHDTSMDIERQTAALELIQAAEEELLTGYREHVTGYAHARQDRFDV